MLARQLALAIAPYSRERQSTSTSPSSPRDFSSTIALFSPSGSSPIGAAISCKELRHCRRVLWGCCLFQQLRVALAARGRRLGRKLALHHVRDHADQCDSGRADRGVILYCCTTTRSRPGTAAKSGR